MSDQSYQGDVGILQLSDKPKITFKPLENELVVALGETTGHRHVITKTRPGSIVEFGQDEYGTYIVDVQKGGAVLTHEQHGKVELGVGIHAFPVQHEYDELQELRKVSD
jgi:hypothetical protein